MSILKTLTVNGTTYNVTPVVPTSSVTLLASAWVGGGNNYSQVVEIPEVTAHTKVDLQLTAEQHCEFIDKVLTFVAENDGGVVTVYAVGDKPTGDHTIQTTLTEVEATGKIRGNTVGTPLPRTDFNQVDSSKADYLRGREKIVQTVNGVTPDENGNVDVPGGGVSSWNDLTDKPFYEESSSETLLEESTYDGFYEDPYLGAPVCDLYPSPFTLTVGEIYRVHWNDEEFICKAQDVSAYADGAVGLGDLSLPVFGGSGNGEPFIIGYAGEYGSMFISLDNKSSNTVAIYHEISEVKTLDAKFLPSPASIDLSAYESDGKIVETYADGSVLTTVMEFDANGKPTKITDSNGNVTVLTW